MSVLIEEYLGLVDDSCVAILPHVLRLVVELDIPELLATGVRTAHDIAEKTGTDEDAIGRLLRALASVGVLTQENARTYRLADAGQRLRRSAAGSVHESVRNIDSRNAWLAALGTLRSGRPVFDEVGGAEFFAHKDGDLPANRSFLRRMRERAGRLYPGFASSVDWSDCGTVMDIGGGDGYQLDLILRLAPHLKGVLFDRPAVIDAVRDTEFAAGPVRLVAGDFFRAVPAGADTHLLCSVLHDWTDDQSVEILGTSREALAPGGRLLIVEMVIPPGDGWHPGKWSDLGMMVLTGGRERTADEFDALLGKSGYALDSVEPLPDSQCCVLTARSVR